MIAVLLAPGPLLLLLLVRLAFVLLLGRKPLPARNGARVSTMVVLGSGGHTAEMLVLMDQLDKAQYLPRCYVVAETDRMSAKKALAREQAWAVAATDGSTRSSQGQDLDAKHPRSGHNTAGKGMSKQSQAVAVEVIPRSREVGQSYITSVGTTLYSLLFAAWIVFKHRPQLVLVNGPGTCIPVCAAAFAYRLLFIMDVRIVYVESIARVRKLSLSGHILYTSRVADVVFVQWPELQARYPRTVHAGRLY